MMESSKNSEKLTISIKSAREQFHSRKGSNYKSFDVLSSMDGSVKSSKVLLAGAKVNPVIRVASPACLLLSILFFVTMLFAIFISTAFLRENRCLGAPFLYVTHHGIRNIMKLSRDGCLLSERVLWGNFNTDSSLRAMAFGQIKTAQGSKIENVMFVADAPSSASSSASSVKVFGDCSKLTGMRTYLNIDVVTSLTNPGAQHPYGISLDSHGNVFASFQHTNAILRFQPHESTRARVQYAEMPSPPLLRESTVRLSEDVKAKKFRDVLFFNGSFAQFGLPGLHETSDRGVRSVLWVPSTVSSSTVSSTVNSTVPPIASVDDDGISNKLYSTQTSTSTVRSNRTSTVLSASEEEGEGTVWVANEDLDEVVVFDAYSGNVTHTIPVPRPISLHLYVPLHVRTVPLHSPCLVFASSKSWKSHKQRGAVYAITCSPPYAVVKTYSLLRMDHPTGLAAMDDVLYVADQATNAIYAFNISSTAFIRKVISLDKFVQASDVVEQIALSDC